MRKLKNEELKRKSVEEFKSAVKIPVIIILDNVRSMNNVGSIFRTADAFLVEGVYLCGITGQPPNKEIHKTALGATESVEWKYFKNTVDAISELKKNNFKIIAVEQAKESVFLNNFRREKSCRYAFVFGNEINGVSEEVMEIVDECLEIPQFGTKHSFNIVVSVGIVLWEFCRT
ncbi:MAG: RNA methyltransferase [Bacteroidales bacterium]|nr:RNA methyltransferase [Bacteroidales bacterium]